MESDFDRLCREIQECSKKIDDITSRLSRELLMKSVIKYFTPEEQKKYIGRGKNE